MRNPAKIALAITVVIIVAIAAMFVHFWPTIRMEFEGSAHYSEQDKQAYEHFTPDILKKMPRISNRYNFNYANIDGSGAQVYAVTFCDTIDTSKVSAYLSSLGYIKQGTCSVEGECWRGSDPSETVFVGIVPEMNIVTVQVDHSPQF